MSAPGSGMSGRDSIRSATARSIAAAVRVVSVVVMAGGSLLGWRDGGPAGGRAPPGAGPVGAAAGRSHGQYPARSDEDSPGQPGRRPRGDLDRGDDRGPGFA